LYGLLRRLSTPDLFDSALTGLLNLSWYELAYVVGGGVKSALLFTLFPYIGGFSGLLSSGLLLSGHRWGNPSALGHIVFSLVVGALSLAVLLWRYWRGIDDPWRLVTTLAFLFLYGCFFVVIRRWRAGGPKNATS